MENTLTSLDKSLSTLIDGATEKGGKLIEYLYTEAPEVVEQLLLWHGAESAIKFVFGLGLIILGPLVIYKLVRLYHKLFKEHIDENTMDHPGFIVPSLFGSVIGLLISQLNGWSLVNLAWLKIWIAPKVYLLDYISNLVK